MSIKIQEKVMSLPQRFRKRLLLTVIRFRGTVINAGIVEGIHAMIVAIYTPMPIG